MDLLRVNSVRRLSLIAQWHMWTDSGKHGMCLVLQCFSLSYVVNGTMLAMQADALPNMKSSASMGVHKGDLV